jgi:hypothetical protein
MKLPTLVVIIQAVCAALVGVAGGGSKLASFLSTSFADYKSNGAADPAVSVILPVAKAPDAK